MIVATPQPYLSVPVIPFSNCSWEAVKNKSGVGVAKLRQYSVGSASTAAKDPSFSSARSVTQLCPDPAAEGKYHLQQDRVRNEKWTCMVKNERLNPIFCLSKNSIYISVQHPPCKRGLELQTVAGREAGNAAGLGLLHTHMGVGQFMVCLMPGS